MKTPFKILFGSALINDLFALIALAFIPSVIVAQSFHGTSHLPANRAGGQRFDARSDRVADQPWKEYKIPGNATVNAVSIISPNSIFSYGASAIFHFDGSVIRVIHQVNNAQIISFDTDGEFAVMVLDSIKERLAYSTPTTFVCSVVFKNGIPTLLNLRVISTDLNSGPNAVGFFQPGVALLLSGMEYGILSMRHAGPSRGIEYEFQRHPFLDFVDYTSFGIQHSRSNGNLTLSSLERVANATLRHGKADVHVLLSLRSLHHLRKWQGEIPYRHNVSVFDSTFGAILTSNRIIFFERGEKDNGLHVDDYEKLIVDSSTVLPAGDIANVLAVSRNEAWLVTTDGVVFRTTERCENWGTKPWRQEAALPLHAGMTGMIITPIDSNHVLFAVNSFLIMDKEALRRNPVQHVKDVPPSISFLVHNLGRGTTYGIGLRDLDNNGCDDIFLINAEGNDRLYLRESHPARFGTSLNVAQERGLQGKGSGAGENLQTVETGVLLGDFDEDGSQDIVVGHLAGSNSLFKNDGWGYFRDVTSGSGLDVEMDRCEVIVGGDVNNDGYLDLFMTSFFGSNKLFVNRGDGTFRERTVEAGLKSAGRTTTAVFGDVNGDGKLDLYVGYAVSGHTLYLNNGDGTFRNATQESGLAKPLPKLVNSSLFADFNNDGALDLLVGTRGDGLRLYLNDGKGHFRDVSRESGLVFPVATYGIVFGDFNNDGLLDIFVSFLGGVRLLLNTGIDKQGIPHFRDATSMIESPIQQIAQGYNTGLATFDDLHDGDLDIVAGQYGGDTYKLENILNDSPNRGPHFLTVQVVGIKTNRDAVGAKLSLFHNDTLVGFREICDGYGYVSTSSKDQHFGLGDTSGIYTLEVSFPASGITKRINVRPGARIEVTELEGPQAALRLGVKWLNRFVLSRDVHLEILKLLLLVGFLVAIGMFETLPLPGLQRAGRDLPPLRLNNRQLILYPVAGYGVTLLLVNLGIRTFLGHDWWTRGTRSIFVEDITPHLVAFGVLALNVARQRQKEVSLAQMRLRIASDLHDEIGSDLSSIVMTSQMMNKSASLDMADKQKLSDIGTTALHTASKMRDIVWFINPEHDNVDDLLLKMKDFTLGIMKDMDYEFRTPDTTIPIRLTPDVRRNVLLIYKEIINNIVKHAGAKKVEIEVWIVDSQFILSVSDDGVGFDEQVVKKGEGLQNLRKRASDLGGTLKIQSCPGKGTNITLTAKIT